LEDVLEEGFGLDGRNDQLALLDLRSAHARLGARPIAGKVGAHPQLSFDNQALDLLGAALGDVTGVLRYVCPLAL
jgi:hypothetical protein